MEQEAAMKAAEEAARYEMYIDQAARQQAKKDAKESKINENESYWVNRVLMTPCEFLISRLYFVWYSTFYRKTIEKAQRDTYYRKMAVMLHPDKNSHPNATYAFTKLKQVFESMTCL